MKQLIVFALALLATALCGCDFMSFDDFSLDFGWDEDGYNDHYIPYTPTPSDSLIVTLLSPDSLVAGTDTTITIACRWKILTQSMDDGWLTLDVRYDSTSDCITIFRIDSLLQDHPWGSDTLSARIHVATWAADSDCSPIIDVCLRIKNWKGRWTWCAPVTLKISGQ